jgi:hypothetical protein
MVARNKNQDGRHKELQASRGRAAPRTKDVRSNRSPNRTRQHSSQHDDGKGLTVQPPSSPSAVEKKECARSSSPRRQRQGESGDKEDMREPRREMREKRGEDDRIEVERRENGPTRATKQSRTPNDKGTKGCRGLSPTKHPSTRKKNVNEDYRDSKQGRQDGSGRRGIRSPYGTTQGRTKSPCKKNRSSGAQQDTTRGGRPKSPRKNTRSSGAQNTARGRSKSPRKNARCSGATAGEASSGQRKKGLETPEKQAREMPSSTQVKKSEEQKNGPMIIKSCDDGGRMARTSQPRRVSAIPEANGDQQSARLSHAEIKDSISKYGSTQGGADEDKATSLHHTLAWMRYLLCSTLEGNTGSNIREHVDDAETDSIFGSLDSSSRLPATESKPVACKSDFQRRQAQLFEI